jgi:hypothetical protein
MRSALRLGVQKTLDVVVLNYQVNLGALSTGYVIPEGLDDDGAEVEMNRVDPLASPTADLLADDFMEICSRCSPDRSPRALRIVWRSGPLGFC